MDDLLNKIYYSKSNPAGYGSVKKLYEAAKKINNKVTLDKVKKFLRDQLTYTLHRAARRRFKRSPIIVNCVGQQYQADLVDMQAFKKDNDNFGYILTAIDVFSRYAFAIPIKSKSNNEVKKAFEVIFKTHRPQSLQTDQGTEFTSRTMMQFYKENQVVFFTARNPDTKASLCERFNRTIKNKMFRIFTNQGTRRYLDFLPEIIDAYNNSVHRITRMKPKDVNHENENIVFKRIYGVNSMRELLLKLNKSAINKKGNLVRIKHKLNPFDKSYYPLWTDRVFKIKKVTQQGKYQLEGKDRNFYEQDVQRIADSPLFRINEIIKVRKRMGKTEYFVSWLNYPSSYNEWIDAAKIRQP